MIQTNSKAMRALISVSDKTGVVDLARALASLGAAILSTGGTAKLLADSGIAVTEVSEHTGFPEMLDGRVKTLHPTIHGGLLARRELDAHMAAIAAHGIAPIDLLVVNLYPFEATVARPDCTLEDAIENIDIGGPAMVRSAAKNWRGVGVLTDVSQYDRVLAELRDTGGLSDATRFALAVAAFNAISSYDGAISDYLSSLQPDGTRSEFPGQANGRFVKLQDLRYGENPHQRAAVYALGVPRKGTIGAAEQLQGKQLSYNNFLDADTALECVKQFAEPACVIVKHANPCGVATGAHLLEAYRSAHATDAVSAFGGIIAFNRPLDGGTAEVILKKQFVEVLVAPSLGPGAAEVLASKPNVRVLVCGPWNHAPLGTMQLRSIAGALLVQDLDSVEFDPARLKVVSRRAPSEHELKDLVFAWKVVRFVKSNAIVFCKDSATIGVGAGQMSRIYSARIAAIKAADAGLAIKGSVMASDAFFPFRDNVDTGAQHGVTAIIQPGGSKRDAEVIGAADEHGLAMVFTGMRHFRH